MTAVNNNARYDEGLTHEDYKTRGESGEYRADLGRYFLPGMSPPPVTEPKPAFITAATELVPEPGLAMADGAAAKKPVKTKEVD